MNDQTSGESRSSKISAFARGSSDRTFGKGFTMIEVIIVLAVAGFILTIIFLAVPVLRAKSNNNGRNNDAARLAALVNEYMIANEGRLPTQYGTAVGQLDISTERWAVVDPPQNSSMNSFPTPDYGSLSAIIINLGFRCENGQLNNVGGSEFAIGFKVETLSGERNSCLQG